MVNLKELKSKGIWDLTLDEIEYVYNNLHMNNFIYAALKMYHESNPPLDKIVRIKKEIIPECLHEYAEKLVGLSPYLGNDDARVLRINYKYYTYNLFRKLKNIKIDEIPEIMNFFSSLSYIPIITEKNTNIDLWGLTVVRELTGEMKKQFKVLISNPDINDFLKIMLSGHDTIKYNNLNKYKRVFKVNRWSIPIIIGSCENNIDNKKLEKAWGNMECIMLLLENYNNIDTNNKIHPSQIQYRNSLYLYGGDFFRRIGEYKKAFEWYIKDVDLEKSINKPSAFPIKTRTIERLLFAYSVGKKINMDINHIKDIIDKKLFLLFQDISIIYNKLIYYIKKLNLDLSEEKFLILNTDEKDFIYKIYTKEQCREFFLLALLYNNIINKIDYKDIGYNKFLDYKI
jgi:hypothetical protein